MRLRRSSDFQIVRQRGRRWAAPLLALHALQNGLPHSRFGFVVGGRVGKAVVRNRVRRRLREAVRARLGCIAPGHDVMIIARAGAAEATYHELAEVVAALLARAGLLGGEST